MATVREIAVISITRRGAELAARLQSSFPAEICCYTLPRWAWSEGLKPLKGTLSETIAYCFNNYSGLVLIMATGIAVRLIAPHLQDKSRDPAVVVMDEQGVFAISLLSGHLGGANALAEEIEAVTGARAVITTASDRQKLPAIDIICKQWELKPDPKKMLTLATSSLINGQGLSFYAGEKWQELLQERFGGLEKVEIRELTENMRPEACGFPVVISERVWEHFPEQTLFLRPPVLWLGLGCRKGIQQDALQQAIEKTFEKTGLSLNAVQGISSVDLKSKEAALLAIAEKYNWKLSFFSREELGRVILERHLNKSDFVAEKIGVEGVCEPAAIAATSGELIVAKQIYPGVTVAVARVV